MNHENQLQAYLTLDPARNRIRIHRQTIRLLKNPAYVQFLVNPEELYIAVLGSDKPISGGTANKVRMSNTSQQSIEFYSTILIKNFSKQRCCHRLDLCEPTWAPQHLRRNQEISDWETI